MSNKQLLSEASHFYKVSKVLGKGAFGVVYECISKKTGEELAVKVIRKRHFSEKQISHCLQEADLLSTLHHPNIVKYHGAQVTESFIFLEMELLKGGSLKELIHQGSLPEKNCAKIMKYLFSAVAYLHRQNVLHRDIKPDNIMFGNSKDSSSLKITDFGLSTKFSIEQQCKDKAGTCIYMAPEQLLEGSLNIGVDIWSCGIILYEIITSEHPLYSNQTSSAYLQKLKNINWKFPPSFPELAKSLFLKCTEKLPIERYSAELALQHPWITSKNTRITRTHLQQVREYQDNFKMKTIAKAALLISLVCSENKVKFNKEYSAFLKGELPPKNLPTTPSEAFKSPRQSSNHLSIPTTKPPSTSYISRRRSLDPRKFVVLPKISSRKLLKTPSPRSFRFLTTKSNRLDFQKL